MQPRSGSQSWSASSDLHGRRINVYKVDLLLVSSGSDVVSSYVCSHRSHNRKSRIYIIEYKQKKSREVILTVKLALDDDTREDRPPRQYHYSP